MCAIALAPLPYGYYTLLRLVVCVASGVIAWTRLSVAPGNLWGVVFVGLALLFNPLIPVHLSRDFWAFLDVGAAVLFLAFGLSAGRKSGT